MPFLLSDENVVDYLISQKFCSPKERNLCQITCKSRKNFNLVITVPSQCYLIKQEAHNDQGETKGELEKHWQFQQFLDDHQELNQITSVISEALYFDYDSSIMILEYLDDYQDLRDFYYKNNHFPVEIAAALGKAIAIIHRSTWKNTTYQNYFTENYGDYDCIDSISDLIETLESYNAPGNRENASDARIFSQLYKRYPSFKQAIQQVDSLIDPSCLIHKDLKLNNILVHNDWSKSLSNSQTNLIKIIDWEKWAWGDPTLDLGSIIASYLRIWLKSLVITKETELQKALKSAVTPLELIQPSLVKIIDSYINYFPQITQVYADFLPRLVQFTGLALLENLEVDIHYQQAFTNNSICMLQVAKTLLCNPRESVPMIFGITQINEI